MRDSGFGRQRVRGAAVLLVTGLGLGTPGCVPVVPLDSVRTTVAGHDAGRLVDVDGQQVWVESLGSGEPVVLIHGFAASSYSWRNVAPKLAEDFRVVALDLNGFGLSDRPADLESYTREGQVELVLRTLDTLGIGSAHFVGHSYGGALTMALVAEYPERVRSMVLVDAAAPEYPTKRRKWFLSRRPLAYVWLRGFALRRGFVRRAFRHAFHDDAIVTDSLVDAYRDRLRVEGLVDSYRQLTRPLQEPPSVEVVYGALDVPALVVWGADDRLVTEKKGRRYAAMLPDYRFVTIAGAGHSPMEEKPAEFLAAVRPFLLEMGDRAQP